MSYILEALKKSETERASQHAPTVTTVQSPDPQAGGSRNWMIWLLPLNVALLVAVLALVLRPGPPAPPTAATSASPEAVRAAPAAPVDAAPPARVAPQRSERPLRRAVVQPAPAPARPATVLGEDALPEPLRSRVAALEFSTHVYADEVDMRAVSIDGERLGEGDRSRTGVEVVEITPDGAVLSLDGTLVYVDVMARWAF